MSPDTEGQMARERGEQRGRGVAVVGAPARSAPAPAADDEAAEEAGGEQAAPSWRSRARTVVPGASRRMPRTPWTTAALVLTTVSVLCAVVFGVKWSQLNAQNDTRATVQRVARDFLSALTNFTPKTVDADFSTIQTYATGDFAKQSNQFFGSKIRQELMAAQAWSRGQFRYVYTQSVDGGQASVYAEVDQTYANNKVPSPVTDTLQVVLAMTDTSNGWKISAVTVLQPPGSTSTPSSSTPAGH